MYANIYNCKENLIAPKCAATYLCIYMCLCICIDRCIWAYKHMDLYIHLYVCGKIHMKIDRTLLVYMLPVYTNICTDVR